MMYQVVMTHSHVLSLEFYGKPVKLYGITASIPKGEGSWFDPELRLLFICLFVLLKAVSNVS